MIKYILEYEMYILSVLVIVFLCMKLGVCNSHQDMHDLKETLLVMTLVACIWLFHGLWRRRHHTVYQCMFLIGVYAIMFVYIYY